MADLREMFSARVVPVVKKMIAAEAEARDVSEGQLIDDLVLTHCRSPGAVTALREYAQHVPLVVAFTEVQALHEKRAVAKPSGSSRNKK